MALKLIGYHSNILRLLQNECEINDPKPCCICLPKWNIWWRYGTICQFWQYRRKNYFSNIV